MTVLKVIAYTIAALSVTLCAAFAVLGVIVFIAAIIKGYKRFKKEEEQGK